MEQAAGRLPIGYEYRLPTEAEWEYACRAGSLGDYSGATLDALGWYAVNAQSRTHDAGVTTLNAWGLFDVHGNVSEWCVDWYDQRYYGTAAADRDPKGPGANGYYRVLRGGSWGDRARFCRSAYRSRLGPGHRSGYRGFRLSLQVEAR